MCLRTCLYCNITIYHLAPCPSPTGAVLQCPNGTTGGVFEDACTFSCNPGYVLQGSDSRMCLADQSWSGGDPICAALNCPTSPPVDNSQVQLPCETQYQSTCTTVCVDGYTGGGGSYTCVVTDVANNSVGWNGSTSCDRGNNWTIKSINHIKDADVNGINLMTGYVFSVMVDMKVLLCSYSMPLYMFPRSLFLARRFLT